MLFFYYYNFTTMPEVLLYGPIFSESSIDFINAISEVEGDELKVRVNTGGGDVMYTYGMIAKFKEFAGTKEVQVDGMAYSGGGFFCLYADNVTAFDVSKFMFHRAAYNSWYEEQMSEEVRNELIGVNADLEKAFRAKIDVPKFEEIKGVKVKDLFSMGSRIDVFLTAKEAKQIGLVNKIISLTPTKKAQLDTEYNRMVASYTGVEVPVIVTEIKEQTNKPINMTIEELQAQHPALYASILSTGVQQGIEQEKDRVGAWVAFSKADAEAVKAGIASGKSISNTEMAELTIKLVSGAKLAELEDESKEVKGANAAVIDPVVTAIITPEASFEASIMSKLNLKKQ